MFKVLSSTAALFGCAAILSAQAIDPDTFKVSYYANANKAGYPDATVQIINVGTQNGAAGDASGNLCAMIYVFSPDQELDECCGCPVTPDGLITIDVNDDLTSNPLTGITLFSGDIKIISSTGYPTCNPRTPKPAAGIRAWATHIQNQSHGSYFQTETAFSDSSLSADELSSLASTCAAVIKEGTGFGVCTCGTGD
jgi:hypothetical protein